MHYVGIPDWISRNVMALLIGLVVFLFGSFLVGGERIVRTDAFWASLITISYSRLVPLALNYFIQDYSSIVNYITFGTGVLVLAVLYIILIRTRGGSISAGHSCLAQRVMLASEYLITSPLFGFIIS